MPFSEYENLISERFSIELQDLDVSFRQRLSETSAYFTKHGSSSGGNFLRALIDAHVKELKIRTEALCTCILKIMDAAGERVGKYNIEQVIDYINRVIAIQITNLKFGSGHIKNILQNNAQGSGIFEKDMYDAENLEKRRIKNHFETLLMANENSIKKDGSPSVTNINNYGNIVGLQTGAGSILNQHLNAKDAAEILKSLSQLKTWLESGAASVGLTQANKVEIIDAAEAIEHEVKSDKKNKHAVLGALSVLGGWAEKIEAVKGCYEYVKPMLISAAGYL